MPRIEIETEQQFDKLNGWIYGKLHQGRGNFLTSSNIPHNHAARIYEVDGEPIVLWSNDRERFDSFYVSERHAEELKTAGVIFESSRWPSMDSICSFTEEDSQSLNNPGILK
ncbi:MAG: hypothetical protein HYT08_02405 [Candidatus Levybacteria bacterium]|nr:hypothetical protein [Candidatus Levybacteria bacterium]